MTSFYLYGKGRWSQPPAELHNGISSLIVTYLRQPSVLQDESLAPVQLNDTFIKAALSTK